MCSVNGPQIDKVQILHPHKKGSWEDQTLDDSINRNIGHFTNLFVKHNNFHKGLTLLIACYWPLMSITLVATSQMVVSFTSLSRRPNFQVQRIQENPIIDNPKEKRNTQIILGSQTLHHSFVTLSKIGNPKSIQFSSLVGTICAQYMH